ncbi:hypothetical protein F383_09335 [Gossypium arboreum]|uniref:Uncharacterized protein n=1 Tax=Gossypium arboreum TaxID=29729 RepID=A0A0B0PMI8_GOSAR|nr:hypothetical protein F383_00418 [Gossypium arboreum]KHG24626.1 hypothetical protein F383_09335 [Gossypium arboreum]
MCILVPSQSFFSALSSPDKCSRKHLMIK